MSEASAHLGEPAIVPIKTHLRELATSRNLPDVAVQGNRVKEVRDKGLKC